MEVESVWQQGQEVAELRKLLTSNTDTQAMFGLVSVQRYTLSDVGKMRKVKCGIENAEWCWLVEATNHMTTVILQITTPISQPAMR